MAVYFYGCVTMDGYLADSQHRIDWLHQLGSVEDTGYDDFYRQMDITIMGKRTFEEIQDLQDVESFYQATENYVFTHDRHLPVSNYQPVAGDVVDFVHQIDKGKNVFVIGGNSIVALGCGSFRPPHYSDSASYPGKGGSTLYPRGRAALLPTG